jgi:hypothetical protein
MCVHGNNARNLSVQLSLTQLAKTLCLPYYAYVFSSTKLEIRADRFCLEVREGRGEDMTQTINAHVNK